MSEPIVLSRADGSGHMIHCPACECGHLFDKRWTFNGDVMKPTFSPSMLVRHWKEGRGDIVCHSFVRDGFIEYLGDCTHAMKSTTVILPPC